MHSYYFIQIYIHVNILISNILFRVGVFILFISLIIFFQTFHTWKVGSFKVINIWFCLFVFGMALRLLSASLDLLNDKSVALSLTELLS